MTAHDLVVTLDHRGLRRWLQSGRDSNHADKWSAYGFKLMISRDKASGRGLGENVKHFDFCLACDVIDDPEVNNTIFRSTVFTGLSDAVCDFNMGLVGTLGDQRGGSAEIRGEARRRSEGRLGRAPPPPLPCNSRHGNRYDSRTKSQMISMTRVTGERGGGSSEPPL